MGEAKRRKQFDPNFGKTYRRVFDPDKKPINERNAHRFLCKEYDESDNSYLLIDLTLARRVSSSGIIPIKNSDEQLAVTLMGGAFAPAVGCCTFVKCKTELQEGSIYTGFFDFDPRRSLETGRMPTLQVIEDCVN